MKKITASTPDVNKMIARVVSGFKALFQRVIDDHKDVMNAVPSEKNDMELWVNLPRANPRNKKQSAVVALAIGDVNSVWEATVQHEKFREYVGMLTKHVAKCMGMKWNDLHVERRSNNVSYSAQFTDGKGEVYRVELNFSVLHKSAGAYRVLFFVYGANGDVLYKDGAKKLLLSHKFDVAPEESTTLKKTTAATVAELDKKIADLDKQMDDLHEKCVKRAKELDITAYWNSKDPELVKMVEKMAQLKEQQDKLFAQKKAKKKDSPKQKELDALDSKHPYIDLLDEMSDLRERLAKAEDKGDNALADTLSGKIETLQKKLATARKDYHAKKKAIEDKYKSQSKTTASPGDDDNGLDALLKRAAESIDNTLVKGRVETSVDMDGGSFLLIFNVAGVVRVFPMMAKSNGNIHEAPTSPRWYKQVSAAVDEAAHEFGIKVKPVSARLAMWGSDPSPKLMLMWEVVGSASGKSK